ncbi:hypothetical protein BH09PSE6_BH09PSE6_20320 [soil metagenome]
MTTARKTAKKADEVWDHAVPAKKAGKKPLTPASKAAAKQAAKKAGRPYPNMVDNINAAKKQAAKKPAKKRG